MNTKLILKTARAVAMAAAAALMPASATAQTVLAGWEASGLANSGPSPYTPTTNNANLTIAGLTRGSGLNSTTTANVWGANSWQTNPTNEATAIASNKFVTFSITPNSGFGVSISGVSNFYFQRSATGPNLGSLQWSTNGTTFTDVAALTYGAAGTASIGHTNIDLSGVAALQNIAPGTVATFRLVNWGATGAAGTWYISNGVAGGVDFDIQGTVSSFGPAHVLSITPGSISTNAGATVAFTVNASGSPASNYWYKVAGGTTNLIPTATTPVLTLANVTGGDTASYFDVVSNSLGMDTSAVVTLSVTDPFIIAQPVSQPGLLNGTVQFTVSAGGAGLNYQWYQFDGVSAYTLYNNGLQPSGAMVTGATSDTLTINNLQLADATNFAVVITGTSGTLTSSPATLTVGNHAQLALWTFNGNFNVTNPAVYQGFGTAAAMNCVPFSQPNQDGNDNTATNPTQNFAWGTETYPTSGSNKLAGVQFNVSMLGAKNPVISYDTRGTTTASKYTRLQYTTNGTDFVDFPASTQFVAASIYSGVSYSLAGFPGVANNPQFGVRLATEFESTATYGTSTNTNYTGITAPYTTAGTLSYDLVSVSADAITNANTPPTITAIGDQTLTNGLPGVTVNFTVGDIETAANALTVTAASLNPDVPLIFTNLGTGANRSLSVTPQAPGATPVLVTVKDGNGDTTVTWFYVTILDKSPTISGLGGAVTLANTPVTVPLVVSSSLTDPSLLTLSGTSGNQTLLTNDVSSISFGGSGTNRTVTYTPVNGQLGLAPVTITVHDPVLGLDGSQTTTLMVRPNTNVILADYFNYDSIGSITTVSDGFWKAHSGISHQMQSGGGVVTVDGVNNTEDVNAAFIGGPYPTNSATKLYASFLVNLSSLPILNGTYFAHFKDNTTSNFFCRIFTSDSNAISGTYRIGIGNGTGADGLTAQVPIDLQLNSNYTVVVRMVASNGVSTVWVNPATESSPSTTDHSSVSGLVGMSAFAFRESTNEGIVNVSKLKVGLTFDSVLPSLQIQPTGNNVVLTSSDPTLAVQGSTNVAGPYSDVANGTPFTNNAVISPALYFRFKP